MIRFTSNTFAVEAAGPDGEARRTITGIAVPYNTFATVSDGTTVQFAPGSLPIDGKAPRLYMYHDSTQPVGLVAEYRPILFGNEFSYIIFFFTNQFKSN